MITGSELKSENENDLKHERYQEGQYKIGARKPPQTAPFVNEDLSLRGILRSIYLSITPEQSVLEVRLKPFNCC